MWDGRILFRLETADGDQRIRQRSAPPFRTGRSARGSPRPANRARRRQPGRKPPERAARFGEKDFRSPEFFSRLAGEGRTSPAVTGIAPLGLRGEKWCGGEDCTSRPQWHSPPCLHHTLDRGRALPRSALPSFAPAELLQLRQRTASPSRSVPPSATGSRWSTVRSTAGCGSRS
jgi:hypothetical protein